MDKCPTCERKFENLEDFPGIHLTKIERLQIPDIIISSNRTLYREKKSIFGKRKIVPKMPEEVLEEFADPNKKYVSYNNRIYIKESEFDQFQRAPSVLRNLKSFTDNIIKYSSSKDVTNICQEPPITDGWHEDATLRVVLEHCQNSTRGYPTTRQ